MSFPSFKPQLLNCTVEDRGGMNFIYWTEVHITKGLRFPLATLVHQFFRYTRLHPVHTHVNIFRVLLGVCVLNHRYNIHLRLKDVIYAYTIKRHSLGKYYFVADAKTLQLVINLPDTSTNKSQVNVLLFGAWGCFRDPMLRGFKINLGLKSGRALDSRFVLSV